MVATKNSKHIFILIIFNLYLIYSNWLTQFDRVLPYKVSEYLFCHSNPQQTKSLEYQRHYLQINNNNDLQLYLVDAFTIKLCVIWLSFFSY